MKHMEVDFSFNSLVPPVKNIKIPPEDNEGRKTENLLKTDFEKLTCKVFY